MKNEDIIQQGILGYQMGKKLEENPYDKITDGYKYWIEGWEKERKKFEDTHSGFDKQYKYLEEAYMIGDASMEESEASDQAKKLGLVHRGFGKYSKDKTGPTTYKTQKGALVYSTSAEKKDIPKRRGVGGETEKEKEEKKHHVIKKDIGLTNIKRISSEYGKAAYSFRFNGKYNEMVFTKGEYSLMVKKHINPSKIILARIEKAQKKKQGPQMGKAEKKLLKRKEYQQKKRELGDFEPVKTIKQVQSKVSPKKKAQN